MKCQNLFFVKSEKNIINLPSAELAQIVVKVKNHTVSSDFLISIAAVIRNDRFIQLLTKQLILIISKSFNMCITFGKENCKTLATLLQVQLITDNFSNMIRVSM